MVRASHGRIWKGRERAPVERAWSAPLVVAGLLAVVAVARPVRAQTPPPGDESLLFAPIETVSAVVVSVDRVIGMGQNKPLAIFMPSQIPAQSACDMKPSRGVNPPIPSMIRSPFSRELTRTLGKLCARANSAASASPSRSNSSRPHPP